MMKKFTVITYIVLCMISFSSVLPYQQKPRVAIITSLYKGDEFIKGFMEDIVQQSIFNQCEFIIINADSPGNEEHVIMPYLERYPNIIYERLDYDPGIYGVWNMAIELSSADYITNANLDDRLHPDSIAIHADFLDQRSDIDLVYSDCYVTEKPNETFAHHSAEYIQRREQFSLEELKKCCLPHNHPMWRRSMHDNYGLFNANFKIAGDWEMWLRAATGGAQFAKIDGVYSLYYLNPKGLSSNEDGSWREEFLLVFNTYVATRQGRRQLLSRHAKNMVSKRNLQW